jgi:hypothetical protein
MLNHQSKAVRRVVFRVQMTLEAKERLAALSDNTGITQLGLTMRVLEWFAGQPEEVRAAVLGLYPESIRQEVAELLLKR